MWWSPWQWNNTRWHLNCSRQRGDKRGDCCRGSCCVLCVYRAVLCSRTEDLVDTGSVSPTWSQRHPFFYYFFFIFALSCSCFLSAFSLSLSLLLSFDADLIICLTAKELDVPAAAAAAAVHQQKRKQKTGRQKMLTVATPTGQSVHRSLRFSSVSTPESLSPNSLISHHIISHHIKTCSTLRCAQSGNWIATKSASEVNNTIHNWTANGTACPSFCLI